MELFCSFQLHKKVETLQEENHKLSELASEAEYLAGVLKVGSLGAYPFVTLN